MKRSLLLIPGLFLSLALNAQSSVIFEEQFDGGIPDTWEIGPGEPEGASWQWRSNGEADSALVNGQMVPAILWLDRQPINSPSVDNGVAMYNSDVYDAGGQNVGQGPFPNGTIGRLTSPSIDCSGESTVLLSFHQYARVFSTSVTTFVEVSNDGGETWTDFPVNRLVTDNRSSSRSDVQLIDISRVAANEPDVKVRFTWDGQYFFWLIDDVRLMTPPQYALSLDTFFYTPASYAQPVSQVATDTFAFNIEMSNLGSEPIPNLVFKARVLEVMGTNTQLVYEDSLVLDEFPAFYQDSTLQLEDLWAPELEIGNYQLRFEIYSLDQGVREQDYTPFNDIRSAPFRVTAIMFAKEEEPDVATAPEGDYQVGNFYQMSPMSGNNFQIRELRFAAAKFPDDGPLAGEEVTFLVYKVKDEVEANWSNFETDSDESLEIVGFGTYEFSDSDDNFDVIIVPVVDLDSDPIALEPGARYFVMASYAETSNEVLHAFEDDIDYFQVSTIVFTDQWYLGGFGEDLAAVLRMVIELSTGTDEIPLEDSAMTLFPNPSSELLNVQLDLEEATPAMLIVADMQGKVLDIREYDNVQKETLEYKVHHLPAGTYLMRISTDKGTKTKQFVVAK